MKSNRLTTIVLIALLIVLIYFLYDVLDGDPASFMNFSEGNPLETVTASLRALGDSIGRVFANILP
jgi:succinate dehydrogenase hydrophobic anchor subunit